LRRWGRGAVAGGEVEEMMTDDDLVMLRACFEAGLFCLGVGGLWVIVSVVREWWRGRR
jgi:hypothetical protein